MNLRRRYLPLVALLGAAVAVLPTVADSTESSPTVNARAPYSWSPSEVAAKPSQAVTFQNSSEGLHGVIWKASDPETPACEKVPIGHGEASWAGTCTFSKEGVYEYECAVHRSLMTGRVYVNADGTISTVTIKEPPPTTGTTTISEPPPTTSTTKTTPPPTTATSTTPAPGTVAITVPIATTGAVSTPAPGAASAPSDSHIFGPSLLADSLKLTVPRRSASVHVSIKVGHTGIGGRLAVDLLATEASLGNHSRKGAKQVVVGHLSHSSVSSGGLALTISLTARARHALARHHTLSLIVKIVLVPTQGTTQTLTGSVKLHT